jgi:hypothetical protein
VKVWSGLRSWALDVLAAAPGELVGALLDDEEVEEAWRAAVKYECAGVEVVRRRGETHPGEVVGAYRALVVECVGRGGRDSYREAGVMLREMAGVAEVGAFVAELKVANARRSALLDELRRAGF